MRRLAVIFCFALLAPNVIMAESEGVLNQLLAPGPLMGAHEKLEKTGCFQCHDAGKGVPVAKCLACHKEIKTFVEHKAGFHGLTTKSCTACHSDHKGRDYDSISVNTKTFDHGKMTGFALEGKHAQVKCQDCHTEKRSRKYLNPQDTHYLGAAVSCKVCHRKDDIHHFIGKYAKSDCNACHGAKTWKTDLKFNHDHDTHYKLEERHAELSCKDCHLVDKKKNTYKYQWPQLSKSQCLSCHQDFHKDKLSSKFKGGECIKCHDQTHWKIAEFDHKVTGYPLNGKHADLKCVECHKQGNKKKPNDEIKNFAWTGLKSACLSCHQDVHKFGPAKSAKFGDLNQCLKCHDEASWKKIHGFDHDHDTRYAIDGKHLELKCEECHLPKKGKNPTRMPNPQQGVYHWPHLEAKTCENCHTNPHLKQFKKEVLSQKCTVCHVTGGWNLSAADKKFDHSKTRFALTGEHTAVSCNECHVQAGKKIYKFKSAALKFCIDCHQNVHKKQFSDKFSAAACSECHGTKNFTDRLPFDHGQTNYKLEGSHAKLNCVDCHKPTPTKFALQKPNIGQVEINAGHNPAMSKFLFPEMKGKQCLACHEDYHRGQLASSCQDCHTVNSWKNLKFDHDLQSQFPLLDKHAVVDCKKCHVPVKNQFVQYKNEKRPLIHYKPVSQECVDCHKDPHRGAYGKTCADCHNAKSWQATKDFHKNFTLSGVHLAVQCAECHKDNRKLAGLDQDCFFCHLKDDVHHGTLPKCKECHLQSFWEQTSFKHSMTRFPLLGVHRTLECGECHNRGGLQGIYQGLNSQCQSCHLQDAIRATSFNHVASGNLTNCQNCHHNAFSFASH